MEQDDYILSANIAPLDLDTITLTDSSDLIDFSNMGSISISPAAIPTITLGGSGGSYSNGSYTYTNNGWGTATHNAIKIQGNAEIDGSLTVDGVNIMDILNKITDRLAILVPDPAKLEKYAALKEAYDHYKTLEALCVETTLPPEAK